MERVFNRAKNHKEAEEWDIIQQLKMTPDERRKAAYELKKRVYGENPPDVRSVRHETNR
jgi:hypothetical protein